MAIDFSQYRLVMATGRPEAQIAQALLKQANIDALIKQDDATEALSVVRGNAVLPFETWGVYVKKQFIDQTREILKDGLRQHTVSKVKETTARKILKPFIWLFLLLCFVGILISIWEMGR